MSASSDREFLALLAAAIDDYIAAVDRWESTSARYYRMPGIAIPSGDLAAEQREFEARRRQLEPLLPRARALCFNYGRPDVFAGLPRVSLGQHAPQHRIDSAIARGERNAVMACLMELSADCREAEAGFDAAAGRDIPRPSWLDRIAGLLG
jgi:hypothetical protein